MKNNRFCYQWGKMRKCKFIFLLIILVFLLVLCNPIDAVVCETVYDDKEISSILFSSNGNWIPNRKEKLINFEDNTYSTRNTIAEQYKNDYLEEYNKGIYSDNYSVIKNLSEDALNNFHKSIIEHGIYNVEERYYNQNVYDGGSWSLTITFSDGTTFKSRGYAQNPNQAHQIDLDCYQLFNEQFFGTLGREYFEPPTLGISIDYIYDNGSNSLVTAAQKCSYEWRSLTKNEDIINLYQNDNLHKYFSDNYDSVHVRFSPANKCKKAEIYKMDLDGANKILVVKKKKLDDYTLVLEKDKIYVIDIEFDNGNVEYAFAFVE